MQMQCTRFQSNHLIFHFRNLRIMYRMNTTCGTTSTTSSTSLELTPVNARPLKAMCIHRYLSKIINYAWNALKKIFLLKKPPQKCHAVSFLKLHIVCMTCCAVYIPCAVCMNYFVLIFEMLFFIIPTMSLHFYIIIATISAN